MKKVGIIALFMLTACFSKTKSSSFYNVVALWDGVPVRARRAMSVAVDVVELASYLNKPQMVTRKEKPTELNVSELNRWIEPLDKSIRRVIADNLSMQMENVIVRPSMQNRKNYDYVVSIEINKMDGQFGGDHTLDAWWSIIDRNNIIVISRRFRDVRAMGDDYGAMAQIQSEALQSLSSSIAKELVKLK